MLHHPNALNIVLLTVLLHNTLCFFKSDPQAVVVTHRYIVVVQCLYNKQGMVFACSARIVQMIVRLLTNVLLVIILEGVVSA